MKRQQNKFFIYAGIIAPLIVMFFITFFGLLWQGNGFFYQYISALGTEASPFRIFNNIFSFALFGIIMIGVALNLDATLPANRFTATGTRLLISSGILIFLLSIFPTDLRFEAATLHGKLHTLIGSFAFAFVPFSILWYSQSFRRDERWNQAWPGISYFFAAVGLASAAILQIFPNYPNNGWVERIGIGAGLLWISSVSINLLLIDITDRINKKFSVK